MARYVRDLCHMCDVVGHGKGGEGPAMLARHGTARHALPGGCCESPWGASIHASNHRGAHALVRTHKRMLGLAGSGAAPSNQLPWQVGRQVSRYVTSCERRGRWYGGTLLCFTDVCAVLPAVQRPTAPPPPTHPIPNPQKQPHAPARPPARGLPPPYPPSSHIRRTTLRPTPTPSGRC